VDRTLVARQPERPGRRAGEAEQPRPTPSADSLRDGTPGSTSRTRQAATVRLNDSGTRLKDSGTALAVTLTAARRIELQLNVTGNAGQAGTSGANAMKRFDAGNICRHQVG
jgi:hypothetical protein